MGLSLVKLAARNIMRQWRRTLITSSAISFGLALLILGSAMGDGMHRDSVKTAISMMSGHVVVQARGWQEERDAQMVVRNAGTVVTSLAKAFPDAKVVQRIFLQGLLTSTHGSTGVALTAVDPAVERQVSTMHEKVIRGEFVGEGRTDVVIGATLAETLDVDVGDKVVLMLQVKGVIESRLFRVKGVFKTGADELDGFFGMITLPAAQEVLGVGNSVTQVAVVLDHDSGLLQAQRRAQSAVGRPDELEVLTWKEALPELRDYIVLDDASMYVLMLVIALIAAIGVLNTVLMSVLERIREFGTMLALGTTPGRLSVVVAAECLLLGLLAAVVGLGVGLALSWPLCTQGLDYSSLVEGKSIDVAGVPMSTMIYGYISWPKMAIFSGLTVLITVLSGLYPVWWVSRLTPVKAMAHR